MSGSHGFGPVVFIPRRSRPDAVAATTLQWVRSPLAQVESTGVALAVGGFFAPAYLTIWSLAAAVPPRRG